MCRNLTGWLQNLFGMRTAVINVSTPCERPKWPTLLSLLRRSIMKKNIHLRRFLHQVFTLLKCDAFAFFIPEKTRQRSTLWWLLGLQLGLSMTFSRNYFFTFFTLDRQQCSTVLCCIDLKKVSATEKSW